MKFIIKWLYNNSETLVYYKMDKLIEFVNSFMWEWYFKPTNANQKEQYEEFVWKHTSYAIKMARELRYGKR